MERARLPAALVAFAAVTLVAVLIAQPLMLTGFQAYDDEGYMLIALHSFVHGGELYDDVFTQYGPFYYEAWGGLFSLFGIPVDLDSGRIATLVSWVLASLILGLSIWRMTGSILLGILVQVLVFATLGVVRNEPMHPGGLICLLLAMLVAISCAIRARLSPGAIGLLGGVVAALLLVKINVGAFALAAVVLACAVSYPALSGRWWLRLTIEAAFVAMPLALMAGDLGEPWAREYAFHVSIAALAVVVVLRSREPGRRDGEELWWLGGGFLAATGAILLAILGAGTSLGSLLDGVLAQPLRQGDAFKIPLAMSERFFVFDGIALAAALAYLYASRSPGAAPVWGTALPLFSVLVGIELVLSPIGRTLPVEIVDLAAFQLALVGFAWVALLPAPGADSSTAFARLLLPPLAVMQALHAYPVAGSQLNWAAFLLVPVGALCVANGVRGLSAVLSGRRERRAAAAVGVLAAVALALFVADTALKRPLDDNRAAFRAAIPLDLPGARSVRVGEPELDVYRRMSAAIDANCATLVMLPGMNSFYFWADRAPPTSLNATAWPVLLGEDAQRRVIRETRPIDDLCLLENPALAGGWTAGQTAEGPLLRDLGHGFEPVFAIGDYRLSRRDSAVGGAR